MSLYCHYNSYAYFHYFFQVIFGLHKKPFKLIDNIRCAHLSNIIL